MVGRSDLVELGGFQPGYYVELDMVGLDLSRARAAVERLIHRHDHLRVVVDAAGTQRVLTQEETGSYRFTVTDLTGLDEQERESALVATRRRMCEEGVDPTRWPLFDVVVQRLRPDRVRAHIAMSLLLLDGRGIRQVVEEWRAYYDDPDLVPDSPEHSYRDSLLALLGHQDSDAYRTQWAYWQARLDSLPDAPQLPLAVQPSAIRPVRFTRRVHRLTAVQWANLSAAFRRHRVLPTSAMLHVFAETVGAWASSPRFCLNMLHQNWAASRPETAGVLGQFGATLPVEVDLGAVGDGFFARAQNLQRQVVKDLQNSEVAGVRITRELAARRGWTSRAALPYVFTSMLSANPSGARRRARTPTARREPLSCQEVFSDLRTPQVLIDNQLHDGPDGGVDCIWDTVDDAFPPGLPDLMFQAYSRMLDDLATPDGAAAHPDPVSPAHRDVVAALNPTPSAFPAGRLEDGFLEQAALRPDATAVLTDEKSLTYGELELRSRALASALAGHGVGRGDVVPVVMAKGWEQVVAVLGVLRTGAAYCPIDVSLPDERIAHLLDGCFAPAVLVQPAAAERIRGLGERPVLCVDADLPAPVRLTAPESHQDDLAYIIYTSGSTGLPKGVMIEHGPALNTVADINERLELDSGDRVFGISSLSFDLSVWDVFGTLAAGAALVLPGASGRPDPVGWARTAVRFGATVWNSVPALAQMLAETDDGAPRTGRPPIRAFLMSGDWIPTTLPDLLRERWPGVRLIAMGGATEASIWSNIHEVEEPDPAWRSVPYGVPLRNQTMRILDHRFDVRPPWAVGRIHIGGIGLSRGYWRDPDRTADRFVPHPVTGERLYTTGDLGCYRPDGTIEFLGREDRQLKIQGFRVEPGEVEATLLEHPAVQRSAVDAVRVAGGQLRLAALVVPAEGARPEPEELLAHLRARLPHYLVPGRLHVLDTLPLTANGKVDVRGALAAFASADQAAADTTQVSGPGGDGVLHRLSALWAELLELPSVEPDSDFFSLGGNSLLALRLVNRIRTDLGADLAFGQVFEAPTVRALAARIVQDKETDDAEGSGGRARRGSRVSLSGRGSSDGQELFLFHPVGGSVAAYTSLAQAWDGPVHAFQSAALAQGTARALPTDVPGMARAYREELQALRPEGPYLLGGWSMGGMLAHEVAAQLSERGHQSAVFMIDSDLAEVRGTRTEHERHVEFLTDLAGGRLPAGLEAAVRAAPEQELNEAAARGAIEQGLLPPESGTDEYALLQRVHAHHLTLLDAHRPQKLDAPVLLFVAGRVERVDPVPAWLDLCPRLTAEVHPEDHYSIVADDQLTAVAERVRAWAGA
ncbi:amino acid adenylation domain-containing protein [Streptomyces coelicoflavus]|uniref:Phenyloxazoline synthase MbtB n=1 Tax=Streptomyces coelicoflavus TaxID=285562 RepID=A0A7K3PVH8_9ACTN|nr:non-ribosomal peptide synthetase [Streptomyces coelicoflavus]NEB13986.1 amino acid adenylation domain-containing protein [Streptomyces coelicoflavus]